MMLMKHNQIRTNDWVVVCDGRKALILENAGDEKFLNLRTREVHEHSDPPTHVIGSDRPGRVSNPANPARSSAVAQTDWHDEAERSFLHQLARRLESEVQQNGNRKLFIVAAPRALGMFREAMTPALQHAIKLEHDGDWVKLPLNEIEEHLKSLEGS
jgi:protein required for attachment to host cells